MTVISSPSMVRRTTIRGFDQRRGAVTPHPSRGAWAYKYPSLDSQQQIVLTFRNKK